MRPHIIIFNPGQWRGDKFCDLRDPGETPNCIDDPA